MDIDAASSVKLSFMSNGDDDLSHLITIYNDIGEEISSGEVNGNSTEEYFFENPTTIYGLVSNSYDTHDYIVSCEVI
ncbi:hypothetical protein OAM77_00750 [Alphaproteobacteria bacterium]|nr:hypothetical protein [Alphaproteobacteria bacterium]MDA9189877.1 hypothetical protein [Alphaproteobacteria bacterium]MDC0394364.1 hypothetical protein [Alphaproteobacteria bacterium]MDC0461654.1 hypothetical protein [Alphaproteobacteria bacterium]